MQVHGIQMTECIADLKSMIIIIRSFEFHHCQRTKVCYEAPSIVFSGVTSTVMHSTSGMQGGIAWIKWCWSQLLLNTYTHK